MSGSRTAVDVPQGVKAELWLSGFGNTDLEFTRKLTHKLPAQARLEETPTAQLPESNLAQKSTLVWLTAATPTVENRGAILLIDLKGAQSDSGLDFSPVPKVRFVGPVIPGRALEVPSKPWVGSGATIVSSAAGLSPLRQGIWEDFLQVPITATATTLTRDRVAEVKFEAAFQRARHELFEDGMDSEFTSELESLVNTTGLQSRDILTRLLESDHLSPYVWAEAMRWIGRTENVLSRESRLWLLLKGLSSSFPSVRDGAILGLASLDDASAIPYMARAVTTEPFDEIRRSIEQVLLQLRSR